MAEFKNLITLTQIRDGAPGLPGAPGQDASKFQFEVNQDEVLKFYSLDSTEATFSPENLEISAFKLNTQLNSGKELVPFSGINDITISAFEGSMGWIVLSPFEKIASPDYLQFDEIDSKIVFNFKKFKDFVSTLDRWGNETEEEYKERIEPYLEWLSAAKSVIDQETILKLEGKFSEGEDTYLVNYFVNVRYGMNSDMAQLSLAANGIYASIASNSLSFDANGLTVKNGGLEIKNNDGVSVLKATSKGNLVITGEIHATSGTFSGKLESASGDFKGEIIAMSGQIGGFTIENNRLISTDENKSIMLNGVDGSIIANNITLGEGASISDYLKLGENVKILNPDKNNDIFLQVFEDDKNTISFDQKGIIVLGDANGAQIKLDGAEQKISGFELNGRDSWSITPTQAEFNNIIARGSIKAATFEYGVVQAIGGILLIRPSSRIKEIDFSTKMVTLDSSLSGFEIDDICLIEDEENSKQYCKIEAVDVNKNQIKLANLSGTNLVGMPIINLGKNGSIGIGINGSTNDAFLESNAISVVQFDGIGKLIPKIILGKLPDDKETYGAAANSYGLYAENVVLNGSLTTKTKIESLDSTRANLVSSYSGIGTTLGIVDAPTTNSMEDRFPNKNLGQILIWAGAEGDSKEQIQASKFFVDQYGNMYAGSGYFDGTIITKSTIEAAEIKTAKLTGSGTIPTEPALIIQDVANGIHFYRNNNPVFQLNSNELIVNDLDVSINTNFNITKDGTLELSLIQLKDGLLLEKNKVSYNNNCHIELTNNAQIILSPDGENNFAVMPQGASISGSLFYTHQGQTRCEYKQVIQDGQNIGYDLYVY